MLLTRTGIIAVLDQGARHVERVIGACILILITTTLQIVVHVAVNATSVPLSWNASLCVFDDFHDADSWIAVFAFIWAVFASWWLGALIVNGGFCLFEWTTLNRWEVPVEVLWLLQRILSGQTCFLTFWMDAKCSLAGLQSGSLRQLAPFTPSSLRIPPLHRNHNTTFLVNQRWPFRTFNTLIALAFRIPFQIIRCLNLRWNSPV